MQDHRTLQLSIEADTAREVLIALRDRHQTLIAELDTGDTWIRDLTKRQLIRVNRAIERITSVLGYSVRSARTRD